MSKPKQSLTLNREQLRELRWFTKNCTGLRQEFYELMDKFTAFKKKLDRLEKTSDLIEKFFKDNGYGEMEEGESKASEELRQMSQAADLHDAAIYRAGSSS